MEMKLNKVDDVLDQVQREVNWVFHNEDTHISTHFVGTCSVCGERRKVLCHVIDMSTECEVCFAKRRYRELTTPAKCPLDVDDFAKI